ncbi:hypothetical protein EHQ96_10535 [Leptospira levettii]|uniref:Uncharacterized protein n=3 Tax=Leptospira TaxID=171 RepID=A0A2N0AUH2_9LEPT|nr:hypothetical protein [Leptospira levettii]PKA25567.1 hypothetical protein CH381_15040 [Leptospira sp. mixed culture ATI2-C-A1]TGL56058.1 hypothetical protein EHQ59_02095 [Leptospira kemamanensis]MCW7464699.1 hypothetical protein [Leptospira levettii]MCW7514871.1 hypothetical protein [Leptospira levettii]PJZ37939.1 hypothetical protein CH354_01385 [Leptospira levettii]
MEPWMAENQEEWEALTLRLFRRVEELELLMQEVRSDLTRYRAVREEWYLWHSAWKEEYAKRATG